MRAWFALTAVLLIMPALAGQTTNTTRLRGEAESVRTRKRLTEAQQKFDAGQANDAIDEWQRVLDESGDDLVLVKNGYYQAARRVAQQALSGLTGTALETYRTRMFEPAKKLLEQGRAKRRAKPLRELLDRYFASSPAEEAILLLADLAFERGEFVEAEQYWQMLLPDADASGPKLPNPATPRAMVLANLLLVRLHRGEAVTVAKELPAFAKQYPEARGKLAGRDGIYAELLTALVAAPPKPPAEPQDWTTFGGSPARCKSGLELPRYWPGRPAWKAKIPRDGTDRDKIRPASFPASKSLAFHPVVLDGFAYLADAGRIFQFDLATGEAKLAFHFNVLDESPDIDSKDLSLPCTLDADFTLTVERGKLYARFGAPSMPSGAEKDAKLKSVVVELEPKANFDPAIDTLTMKATRTLKPPVIGGVAGAWEGAPLVVDGHWYAAFARVDNNRLIHAIACYGPSGASPKWIAELCDSDTSRASSQRHRHELLTLAGRHLVFCSHTGLTIAIQRETGRAAWAYRNTSAAKPPLVSPRDLAPPLFADGTIYIAPVDGDSVVALDADTGQPRWIESGLQVEHLLGVSRGRLIVSLHGPSKGLRALNAATGSSKEQEGGWQQHDDPLLGCYGRGLVSNDLIAWPTKNMLYLIDPSDGRVARPPIAGPHGNLAMAAGVVLVATPTELWAYDFRDLAPTKPLPAPIVQKTPATPPRYDEKTWVAFAAPDFDPAAAPSFATDLEIQKPIAAKRPSVPLKLLGEPHPSLAIAAREEAIIAIDLDSGKSAWECPIPKGGSFDRVAFTNRGTLLVLGPLGVSAIRVKSGQEAWSYSAPDSAKLSAFAFAGSRLAMRCGDRGLVAIDLETGSLAWALDSAKKPKCEPLGIESVARFGPFLGTDGSSFFAQCEAECWRIDPATGTVDGEDETSLADWTFAPFAFKRLGLLRPTGTAALGVATANRRGPIFEAKRPASLSGFAPQARAIGRDVYVAFPRTIGYELQRLGDVGAANLWPSSRIANAMALHLELADADADSLYLPLPGKIVALSRDDGSETWQRDLPVLPDGIRWQVKAGRTRLLLHAERPLPRVSLREEISRSIRLLKSSPTPVRLLGVALNLAEWAAFTAIPLVVLDSESGTVLQKLSMPTIGHAARIAVRDETILIHHGGGIERIRK